MPPAERVREVKGYEIRLQDGTRLDPPLAVASVGTPFKVARHGTGYGVFVADAGGTFQFARALPDAVVASVVPLRPKTLDKSSALRPLLTVAPVIAERDPTATEQAAVAEVSTGQLPDVDLRPAGVQAQGDRRRARGVLRRRLPARSERFRIHGPARARLAGRCQGRVLGTKCQLCGMLVANDGNPDVFLYGHNAVNFTLGPVGLYAEGEFTLAEGTFATVSGHEAIVSFSGRVGLIVGGSKLVEGSASGWFANDGAHLDIEFETHGQVDLEVFGAELGRVVWHVDGSLVVDFDREGLTGIAAITSASLAAQGLVPGVKVVEVWPETRLCWMVPHIDSIIPPRGHITWECAPVQAAGWRCRTSTTLSGRTGAPRAVRWRRR